MSRRPVQIATRYSYQGSEDRTVLLRKKEARPKPGLDRATQSMAPRPFLISGPAYPMMPSWNQVVGFLTEWEGLRRLAA